MNYHLVLAQSVSEIGFSFTNFNTYVLQLSANFLLAILFSFGLIVFAYLCYYIMGILGLFVSQFFGYKNNPELQSSYILKDPSNV